jgi:hypothetical protein
MRSGDSIVSFLLHRRHQLGQLLPQRHRVLLELSPRVRGLHELDGQCIDLIVPLRQKNVCLPPQTLNVL